MKKLESIILQTISEGWSTGDQATGSYVNEPDHYAKWISRGKGGEYGMGSHLKDQIEKHGYSKVAGSGDPLLPDDFKGTYKHKNGRDWATIDVYGSDRQAALWHSGTNKLYSAGYTGYLKPSNASHPDFIHSQDPDNIDHDLNEYHKNN